MGKSNIKGDIAELAVSKRFLELGYWVSIPFGDDAPYDIIVDIDGSLKKIQVKYITPVNGVLPVRLLSSTGKLYCEHSVDMIAVYNPNTNKVYLLDFNNFNNDKQIQLRIEKPKNNQKSGIHLAEEYEL